MTTRSRQPAGRPTGGQFAPEARGDASVSLAPTVPCPDQVVHAVREVLGPDARVSLVDVHHPDEGMPEYSTGGARRTYVTVDAEVTSSDGVNDRLLISAGDDSDGEPLTLGIEGGTDSPRVGLMVDSGDLGPALAWYRDMLPVQRALNEIAPKADDGGYTPMQLMYGGSGPSLHVSGGRQGGNIQVMLEGATVTNVWDQQVPGQVQLSEDPDRSIDQAMAQINVDTPPPGGRAGLETLLAEATNTATVVRPRESSAVYPPRSGLRGNF